MSFLDFVNEYNNKEWDITGIIANINVFPEDIINDTNCFKDNIPYNLSFNPNLTVEFILAHPELTWKYEDIIENIDIKHIINHPEIAWKYNNLFDNDNLSIDYLILIADKITNWYEMTVCMPIKDIINHPELPWDKSAIKLNKTLLVNGDFDKQLTIPTILTIDYVISNPDDYIWENLTEYFDVDIIIQYSDLPWDWEIMSEKDLPIDFIRIYQDKLDFYKLSAFTNPQTIFNNFNLPWKYEYISYNDLLSFDDIRNNPQINWNFEVLAWGEFKGNKKPKPENLYELKFVD
jgi:hypothetical protein